MTQPKMYRLDDADVAVVIYAIVGFLVGVGHFMATQDLKSSFRLMILYIGIQCLIGAALSFFWHVILGRN